MREVRRRSARARLYDHKRDHGGVSKVCMSVAVSARPERLPDLLEDMSSDPTQVAVVLETRSEKDGPYEIVAVACARALTAFENASAGFWDDDNVVDDNDVLYIENVRVRKDMHSNGFGTRVVSETIRLGLESLPTCRRVLSLTVPPSPSMAIFTKLGLTALGHNPAQVWPSYKARMEILENATDSQSTILEVLGRKSYVKGYCAGLMDKWIAVRGLQQLEEASTTLSKMIPDGSFGDCIPCYYDATTSRGLWASIQAGERRAWAIPAMGAIVSLQEMHRCLNMQRTVFTVCAPTIDVAEAAVAFIDQVLRPGIYVIVFSPTISKADIMASSLLGDITTGEIAIYGRCEA